MLVIGEMHLVTFCFAALELLMLVFLFPSYLYKPQNTYLKWYLILLSLLVIYNVTGGLFPNPAYSIPLFIQNVLAYGSGFLMASYFPFYFYKAFDLKLLRWHALYGVLFFLIIPYLAAFVIYYAIYGDLNFALKWGLIPPFIYSIVLLWVILRAIRVAYNEHKNKGHYLEEITIYCAVFPWSALTVIAYFGFSQVTEALFTNLGFLAITIGFMLRTVRQGRLDYQSLKLSADEAFSLIFEANCSRYGLTKTEISITEWLYQGLSNREIANKLFKSEDTVKKHVHNIFRKIGIRNRTALIRVMQTVPDQ